MAIRRNPPTPPQRPNLSPAEVRKYITKLERRIGELEAFDPAKVTQRFNIPEVMVLENAIDEALSAAFGHGTIEYRRYERAARLDHGPVVMGGNPFVDYDPDPNGDAHEGRQYLSQGKQESLALLRQATKSLNEELEDMDGGGADTVPASDRRVRLDHNSPPYTELIGALDRLTTAITALNDYPDLDLKEQQQAELSAGKDLLKPLYIRTRAIWGVLEAPLRWMVREFAGKEIGHLADALWKLLTSFFR